MKIVVSGSFAKDVIMNFPGRFRDFIDPTKMHVLNVSFGVEKLRENFGGTAANICYNLAMLRERPVALGILGFDGFSYTRYLRQNGVNTDSLKKSKKLPTASAYIITDTEDNQITAFNKGAMTEKIKLPNATTADMAIISPESPVNMTKLAVHYRGQKVKYIYDPGQQVTALSATQMRLGIASCEVLIGNDYEIGIILKKLSLRSMLALTRLKKARKIMIVRTLGIKGSEIFDGSKRIRIGIAKPKRTIDPTGAGDAYRAGFLKGLVLSYDWKRCGQMGAAAASFAVEEYGTQNHSFTLNTVVNRMKTNFISSVQNEKQNTTQKNRY